MRHCDLEEIVVKQKLRSVAGSGTKLFVYSCSNEKATAAKP